MTATERRADAPEAVSVNPSALMACIRGAYPFHYPDDIIITGKPVHGSLGVMGKKIKKGELQPGTRFLLQSEGYAIERYSAMQGIDPRNADAFRGYFGKNPEKRYARELTLTAYRIAPNWLGRKDTNGKYPVTLVEPDWKVFAEAMGQITEPGFDWRDIGDHLNREMYDLWLPEGRGKVIVEFDDFGNPAETRGIPWPHNGYYAHFLLDANPLLGQISGHYDVAVVRGGYWPRVEGRCLCVGAYYRRWGANSLDGFRPDGFRPVRGSVPDVKKYRMEEIK